MREPIRKGNKEKGKREKREMIMFIEDVIGTIIMAIYVIAFIAGGVTLLVSLNGAFAGAILFFKVFFTLAIFAGYAIIGLVVAALLAIFLEEVLGCW